MTKNQKQLAEVETVKKPKTKLKSPGPGVIEAPAPVGKFERPDAPKNSITYLFPTFYKIPPLVVHDVYHVPAQGSYVELVSEDTKAESWWLVKFVKYEVSGPFMRAGVESGEQIVLVYLERSAGNYHFSQY